MPIHRARRLDVSCPEAAFRPSLAMNGREGRRVGCVMVDHVEIVVFDMEEDEDAQGEDEADEEAEGYQDEMMDD